jgi:serine/threonine-protein kinase
MGLLAKNPAGRPSSAAAVVNFLNRTTPAADDGTRVLPFIPGTPADPAGMAAGPGPETAESILPAGAFDEREPDSDEAEPKRALPFAKAIVAVGVVLVGVVIAALLREGISDPTAKAGGVVSTPSASVKPVTKATPTPAKTASKKATPKTSPSKAPTTASPEALRALAKLLRETQEGRGARTAREAAKDLDRAASALADGNIDQATDKFQDARRRLSEAQREGRWQSTPQISALFATIGRTLPRDGDGDGTGGDTWNPGG